MNEYEEEVVFEIKMDHLTEYLEEVFLDMMLSTSKKIKERNIYFLKSKNKSKNEPFLF